jgi:hypothetical protein
LAASRTCSISLFSNMRQFSGSAQVVHFHPVRWHSSSSVLHHDVPALSLPAVSFPTVARAACLSMCFMVATKALNYRMICNDIHTWRRIGKNRRRRTVGPTEAAVDDAGTHTVKITMTLGCPSVIGLSITWNLPLPRGFLQDGFVAWLLKCDRAKFGGLMVLPPCTCPFCLQRTTVRSNLTRSP